MLTPRKAPAGAGAAPPVDDPPDDDDPDGLARMLSITGFTLSEARANPMFWASPATAVFIPTTRPFDVTSGPPEFPGLMAASVWMSPCNEPP